METKNPQAFPCTEERKVSSDPLATPRLIIHPGMTLRDYFAAHALPALIARHRADVPWDAVGNIAFQIAERMLEERARR